MHIAIIGASFAGLSAYLVMSKRLGKHCTFSLIDERDSFTYIPALHETLLHTKKLKDIQFSLSEHYKDFVHAKVTSISPDKTITTDTGKHIHADYIVIATGSRTNMYGNPDFKKHCMTVRHPEDIGVINTKIKHATDICVIGGGVTGVEIASILAQRTSEDQHIHLVHSREKFFDSFHDCVGTWTSTWMKKHNVHLHMGSRAASVDENTVTLANGHTIPSTCTILSSGIKINDEAHSQQLTFANEVCTDGYCAVESEHIFAAGDVAIHGLYTTAHNAMLEGRRIGHYVCDQIQGVQKSYSPLENWKEVAIALGEHDGILTNNKTGFYLPYLTGLAKKIVEKRVMIEFKYKVMLPI